MALIASIIFVVGYVLITLEHYWKVNKSITATALAAVLWALIAFTSPDSHAIEEALHIISAETFSLVVFLLAAMTLVEILVHYRFFDLLRAKLFSLGLKDGAQLILIGTLTFFLSAILDNLTTTIVMVQIARRFFKGHNLLVMAGMIVVAANAGGAFSPVGDVTTIMLWLAGKFSALDIILWAFLPSLSILLVSMLLFVKQLKKDSGDETPAPSEQVILSGSDKVVISMSFASFVPIYHLLCLV